MAEGNDNARGSIMMVEADVFKCTEEHYNRGNW